MKINKLETEDITNVMNTFGLSSLCAKVVASKQMKTDEIEEFLEEKELLDPMSANGMQEVIARIKDAKVKQERILVCGDYDADGICATTILYDALCKFGVTCGFYIPNRFKEGYGLQTHTVQMADEKGYSLLITVDNGVKAFPALEEAKRRNLDVIVSDHHVMEEEIPCLHLLHPFLMGEDFQYLSGAGVALEISRALLGEVKEHVVLACVASIADVMQLKKETRTIVKKGLTYLREGYCKPIQMLSNDADPKWDEGMIAFQVVPKLNVTGRLADMANANNTVRYLLADKAEAVQQVSKQINTLNEKRKLMSNDMVELAKTLIHPEYNFQMLYHESFHEGMVGLVAGKLSEEIQQPVMVLAKSEHAFKGSIRSGGFVDLTNFFDGCKDSLSAYGGHKAAAGIGFLDENKQVVQDYLNYQMKDACFDTQKTYDVIPVSLDEISVREVESLRALAPFGEGFREPLFYFHDIEIENLKKLGNGSHLKWTIDPYVEALLFNASTQFDELKDEKRVSFIGSVRINEFRGVKKVNIFVSEAF